MSSAKYNNENLFKIVIFFIVGLYVSISFVSVTLFWLGISITQAHLPLASLLVFLCSYFVYVKNAKISIIQYLKAAILFLTICIATFFLAGHYNDFSYDGQNYHQSAIVELAEGWNPILKPMETLDRYMLKYYPKGPWYAAASVYKATGLIETGKVFNFLLPIATLLLALFFYFQIGIRSNLARRILAVITAFLPAVITELFSYYVDGLLISTLSLSLMLGILLIQRESRSDFLLFLLSLIALFNIKTTGLVYGLIFLFFLGIYLLWTNKSTLIELIKLGSILSLLGVLYIGYNPFVTNSLCCRNPIHPVPFFNPADEQAPAEFIAHNRVKKIAVSLFSESAPGLTTLPKLKLPFTFKSQEIRALNTTSLRYGGMGPLGSGILLLLPFALLLVFKNSRKFAYYGFYITGAILFSILLMPEAWYIRFIPQLWLIPITWLVLLYLTNNSLERVLFWLITILMSVTTVLFLIMNLHHWYNTQRSLDEQIERWKSLSGSTVQVQKGWISQKKRLEDSGLQFEWVDKVNCLAPEKLVGSFSTILVCVETSEVSG